MIFKFILYVCMIAMVSAINGGLAVKSILSKFPSVSKISSINKNPVYIKNILSSSKDSYCKMITPVFSSVGKPVPNNCAGLGVGIANVIKHI